MIPSSYTADAGQASRTSVTLTQIAAWIRQHPERLGVFAFIAARMMERDGLCYRTVFDRVLGAATDAGLSERTARTLVFRGFAFAAAGHPEPPPELEDGDS